MGEGETPDCESVIDGEGGVLTPGLIDIHSHIGLYEDGLGFEGADGNEDTDPATPHLRALDGVNPFDRSFREALEAGVTAAAVSPGSATPIGGQIALLKTAGRRVDDMILKAPLAIKFALGENPKSVYHDKDETPVTRMATAGIIREELYKAKEYFSRKARAEDDPEQDEPDFDIKMEALQPLLWGWGAHTPMEFYNIYHTKADTGLAEYSPYANETVDAYMDEALAAPDLESSYELWKKAQWDGETGVSAEGDLPWIWLVNVDHLYWVRDGLHVAEQKVHPHGHGWSIVNNVDRWYYE